MREPDREHILGSGWDPADRDGWIGPMDRKGLHMATTPLPVTIPVQATGMGAAVASRRCLHDRTRDGELQLDSGQGPGSEVSGVGFLQRDLPAVGLLPAVLSRCCEEDCGGRHSRGSSPAASSETSSIHSATIDT
jgi:hypothetical protein